MPTYGNSLKQKDLERLERVQYTAAKIVTGAKHYTSRQKLNQELGWESIKTRIEFLGLCIFHKIHIQETRPLIRSCITQLDMEKRYFTRSKGGYLPYPNFGVRFDNTYFPYISKLWNNLEISTRSLGLSDFKMKLKSKLKPSRIKHNSCGSKIGNILLTRIRLDRSDLNSHKFTIGQAETPQCMCFARQESSLHYLVDCFIYSNERQTLFSQIEQFIPNFKTFTKHKKYGILVYGIHPENPEFNYTNRNITIAVQNCQNPTQLNSTQLNSKATSVGVRHNSHVFHPPPPPTPTTTNFSATSRRARELKFGTDTH